MKPAFMAALRGGRRDAAHCLVDEGSRSALCSGGEFGHRGLVVDLAVEMARDHVVERVLDGGGNRMAVGDRSHERVLRRGFLRVTDGLLAAIVEGRVRD